MCKRKKGKLMNTELHHIGAGAVLLLVFVVLIVGGVLSLAFAL